MSHAPSPHDRRRYHDQRLWKLEQRTSPELHRGIVHMQLGNELRVHFE